MSFWSYADVSDGCDDLIRDIFPSRGGEFLSVAWIYGFDGGRPIPDTFNAFPLYGSCDEERGTLEAAWGLFDELTGGVPQSNRLDLHPIHDCIGRRHLRPI